MAQTAEEIHARDVTKDIGTQLYGLHVQGNLSGDLNLMELYNRKMILDILSHDNVDEWLSADEQATLEGKLIIKS